MELGPFFMFRKSLCKKAGFFDEQFKCANDFDFAVRLAMHGKIYCLQKNLGYFLNEGMGASTRPNSICPIERTVIELRYGVYDLVDYQYLPQALNYNIYNLKFEGKWIPVSDMIPNYESFIQERFEKWFQTGIGKNFKNGLRKKVISLFKKYFK